VFTKCARELLPCCRRPPSPESPTSACLGSATTRNRSLWCYSSGSVATEPGGELLVQVRGPSWAPTVVLSPQIGPIGLGRSADAFAPIKRIITHQLHDGGPGFQLSPAVRGDRVSVCRFESPFSRAPPRRRFDAAPATYSPRASAYSLGTGPWSRPAWTRSAPGSGGGGPRGRVRVRRSHGKHAFGCVG
jgi:hypothetical protein